MPRPPAQDSQASCEAEIAEGREPRAQSHVRRTPARHTRRRIVSEDTAPYPSTTSTQGGGSSVLIPQAQLEHLIASAAPHASKVEWADQKWPEQEVNPSQDGVTNAEDQGDAQVGKPPVMVLTFGCDEIRGEQSKIERILASIETGTTRSAAICRVLDLILQSFTFSKHLTFKRASEIRPCMDRTLRLRHTNVHPANTCGLSGR